MSSEIKKIAVGGVGAYHYAVQYLGYTGTREEFYANQLQVAEKSAQAVQAASEAAASAASAQSAADALPGAVEQALTDINTAKGSAVTAVGNAQTSAVAAVGTAQTAAVGEVNSVRDNAKTDVNATKATAVAAVTAEGQRQIELVIDAAEQAEDSAEDAAASAASALQSEQNASASATAAHTSETNAAASASAASASATAAGTSETNAAGSATAAAESATSASQSATAAQNVLDSIPPDYSTLSDDVEALKDEKADIDGYYQDMTVGDAEQLVSTVGVEDSAPYNFRTTGGSANVGDRLNEQAVVGVSLPWNQYLNKDEYGATKTVSGITFTNNGDGSVTANGTAEATCTFVFKNKSMPNTDIIAGHKYLYLSGLSATGSNSTFEVMAVGSGGDINVYTAGEIVSAPNEYHLWQFAVRSGATVTNLKCTPQFFDLTAMFGTAIADYIYSLEQANAGAGVAWFKKLFPKDYYAYDVGSLQSVKAGAHREVGFNQWDEEWENGLIGSTGLPIDPPNTNTIRSKNFCGIVSGANYYVTCGKTDGGNQNRHYIAVFFYDSDKQFISREYSNNLVFTAPSNARYFKLCTNASVVVYGGTYNHDICINLSWDGERDGEYEAYEEHNYPLDTSLELRGIPKLDSNNQLYYDGDRYLPDGTVERRYGVVDLGALNWVTRAYGSNTGFVTIAQIPGVAGTGSMYLANAICQKYPVVTTGALGVSGIDKQMAMGAYYMSECNVYIVDSAYATAADFKAAMSGVYLVYELATPTTETAEPYQEIQVCNDFGTEEYTDYAVENGDRDVAIPVGHESVYQNNLRAKLEMAPESPEGDGDYIVRQTNGINEYVPLTIPTELLTSPTTDGTYTLKVTVSDGVPTYVWEAVT